MNVITRIKQFRHRRAAKALLREARAKLNDGGKHWVAGCMETTKADGSLAHCAVGGIRAALYAKLGRDISAEYNPITQDDYDRMFGQDVMYLTDDERTMFQKSIVSEREHAAYRLALQELVYGIRDKGGCDSSVTDAWILAASTPDLEGIVIGWNDGRRGRSNVWDNIDSVFAAVAS